MPALLALEPLSLAAATSEAHRRRALPPGDHCSVRNVLGGAWPLETSEVQIPALVNSACAVDGLLKRHCLLLAPALAGLGLDLCWCTCAHMAHTRMCTQMHVHTDARIRVHVHTDTHTRYMCSQTHTYTDAFRNLHTNVLSQSHIKTLAPCLTHVHTHAHIPAWGNTATGMRPDPPTVRGAVIVTRYSLLYSRLQGCPSGLGAGPATFLLG